MATSYGVSQLGILNALMSGKTKSDIYDMVKEKKEKLFDKGVKASQIEKMDKLFDKRFDNAMDDYRYKLKNRPGMKEYRKKQRSAPASDTGSEFSKGGLTGGQKKLDKNNNNRIDAQDFKILKAEKKGKVMKAKRGDFMERRKKLMGINSVRPKVSQGPRSGGRSALGRIGRAGLLGAVAGYGTAEIIKRVKGKLDERKARKRDEAKVKKMGGGMMKKYTKGGGADTGTAGERRSKLMTAIDRFKRRIDVRKRRPDYIKPPERKPMIPAGVGKIAQSLTPTGIGKQMGRKAMGKMGGGMIGASQMPRYSKGTMVMARGCKLGRKKATKIT